MSKTLGCDHSVTMVEKDGGSVVFETREARLSALTGSLSLRASAWGWRETYAKWARGEPVSAFQRKMLAVSAHYLAHGKPEQFDHREIRALRPLPEKAR